MDEVKYGILPLLCQFIFFVFNFLVIYDCCVVVSLHDSQTVVLFV